MMLCIAFSALLPLAAIGVTAPPQTLHLPVQGATLSLASEFQICNPSPLFSLSASPTGSADIHTYAGPRRLDPQSQVQYDFGQWFNKNAKTIAIVAVAVVLVLILTN
jgi:hypothetical protein